MCRELAGARLISLKVELAVIYLGYPLVHLLLHLRSWMSLKPYLGGSSDSQIGLTWTSFYTHDSASNKDTAVEAHSLVMGRSNVCV